MTAIAVMLLGVLTFHESTRVVLYPLVIGGVAIIASIIGTFAVRTKTDNVERALLQGLIVSGVIAAAAFAPITYWLMRNLTFRVVGSAVNTPELGAPVPVLADRDRRHGAAVRTDRILHLDPLLAGAEDRESVDHRPRHEHHPGLRLGPAGHGAAGDRDRARHPRLVEARGRRRHRHLRHRRRGRRPALADRADRRARRVRPDHRQRGRHRRDGRPARGGAQGHRSARRGRQHDEGRHEGLRDRLGGARRDRAVRRLPERTRAQGRTR